MQTECCGTNLVVNARKEIKDTKALKRLKFLYSERFQLKVLTKGQQCYNKKAVDMLSIYQVPLLPPEDKFIPSSIPSVA